MNTYSFRWGVPALDAPSTPFPNFMFRYYALLGVTRDEFLLIQHLATYRYEDPTARDPFPGIPQLAREMGYAHENSVANLIKSLEAKGMLNVERRAGRTSVYNFAPFAKRTLALYEQEQAAVEAKTQPPHPNVVPQQNVPHPNVDEEDVVADDKKHDIVALHHEILGLMVNSPYELHYLQEIEAKYPIDWIEDAFKRSVESQARKRLPYAVSILEQWKEQGKDAAQQTPKDEPIPLFESWRTVY